GMGELDTNKIIEIILILFIPPLAVWFHDRDFTKHVCLNIFLCFLFWFPAILHAIWYCFLKDKPTVIPAA
ncbi:hypothetical protein PFISCL1PPCAC_21902, partial [Pristionchus fissidentatus]